MTSETVMNALKALDPDKHCWVAGSAAICPALASDIDIWIFPKSKVKPEKFSTDIWSEHKSYATGLASKALEVVVPESNLWPEQKIQVMFVADHIKNIFDLLNQFDVSCHAFARRFDGFLVAHPKATLPGKPIVWLNEPAKHMLYTKAGFIEQSANDRLEKFTSRYANTTIDMLWLPS